jgi:hypothetical protein
MERKKLLIIAVLLSLLLIFPLALGANVMNLGDLPFFGGSVTSSSTTVIADPSKVLDVALQAGNKFTVHLNVSDVSDLFTWQINMNWNSSMLNVSRIIPGEFLARSLNDTSSEALGGVVINSTDNGGGSSLFAESILANVSGIPGPANGSLVSIEFLVLEYGWTDLNITVSGDFPSTLLDSAGTSITFTTVGYYSSFYFRNKLVGDIDGDRDVDWMDFGDFAGAYGSQGPPQVPVPDPDYNREADLDLDGDVDWMDFGDFAGHYGDTI